MNSPLAGRSVLVTRPLGQATRLADTLAAEGARAVEAPAIRIEPPLSWGPVDAAIERGGYDWVVFTSANGVRFFFERLIHARLGAAWFESTRLAAIGPETARALASHGVRADFVPNEYVAEALVACLSDAGPLTARRVLLPRADIARDVLARRLAEAGAVVDEVAAYRTVAESAPPDLVGRLQAGEIDVVTFTSSSTVRALVDMLGPHRDLLGRTTIACIGPVTAATAREAGLEPQVVATTYTVPGLVDAIRSHFAAAGRPEPDGQKGAPSVD